MVDNVQIIRSVYKINVLRIIFSLYPIGTGSVRVARVLCTPPDFRYLPVTYVNIAFTDFQGAVLRNIRICRESVNVLKN